MTVIGFFSRTDENAFPGGDTVQAAAIMSFLAGHGYEIRRITFPWSSVSEVDLVVIFNLTRPYEAYMQSLQALSGGIPYIVFPVYWDLDSLSIRGTITDTFKSLIPRKMKDYMRWKRFTHYFLQGGELGIGYSGIGSKEATNRSSAEGMTQFVLDHSYAVCPNSTAEEAHLGQRFSLTRTSSWVIRNGFSIHEIDQTGLPEEIQHRIPLRYVVCVGAIGPRKNQLNLVHAANETGTELVIVGGVAPGADRYARAVKRSAGQTVQFLGRQTREISLGIMARSVGHIQPSYIETPGLASLEAAALGRPIAVSDVPPVREYFGEHAIYCKPESVESIAQALIHLPQESPSQGRGAFVRGNYSWDKVLSPLLEILAEVGERRCRQ